MHDFLLLPGGVPVLLVDVVRDINLDSELITELVDASALRANDPAHIFLVDVEFR